MKDWLKMAPSGKADHYGSYHIQVLSQTLGGVVLEYLPPEI